jgi:hypothetical protein
MSAAAAPGDRLAKIAADAAAAATRAYRASLLKTNPGLERRYLADRRVSTAEWLGEVDRRQNARRFG